MTALFSPNSKNGSKQQRIPLRLSAICSSESIGLVVFLNEGSPTLVVPPPNKMIGLCPCF